MMSDDDNDGQMIFGDLGGQKLPDICLTGEVTPRKNRTQETCPDQRSYPGPGAWQARMLPPVPQRWTKCLETYLGLRKTQLQETGESYIMLSYMYIGFFTFRKQHWSYGAIFSSEHVPFMLMYLFISRLNKHINSIYLNQHFYQSHSPVYRLNNFI